MATGLDFGYYTLPVIPSFDGIESKSQTALNRSVGGLGTKLGKFFGKNLADGVVESEAQLRRAYDNVIKVKDKAADSTGKLAAAEAKLQELQRKGAANDRIVAATSARDKARRDETRSIKEATTAQSDYENSLKRHNSSKASGDVDALGFSFEGMAGKASMAGAALGTAAVAGLTAAAAGAITLTKELYDLGAQWDDTFDSLQITTGASGAELDALGQSVKNLGRSVPLPFAEIGKVVGEVNRSLHLTGPELDRVAKTVANLGRMTGDAVDVRELGKAFRSFGVDAKDQEATLNSLFGAFQDTGKPVNELIATVVKGGPALRQFGLSFGQSAGLISSLDEAGLDAEKAVAALTKGLGTLAGKGTTGPEALRQTVSQIKALADAGRDAEALNLANKIFGGRGGGVQFFDAIKSGALDLQTLQSALSSTGTSINDTAAQTDDFDQKWELFKHNAASALEPLSSTLFEFVNVGLTDFSGWVQDNAPAIIEFFGSAADVAIILGQTIISMTSGAVRALALLVGGVGNVVGTFLKAGAAVDDFFGRHDKAEAQRKSAEDAFAWGKGLNTVVDAADDLSNRLFFMRKRLDLTTEQMAAAAKLTSALGEATASIPDGKTIQLSENTPEIRRKLDAVGVQVKELPDGTVTVTANTDEGQKVIDAWRKSVEKDKPATVPVTADTTEAERKWAAFRDMLQNPGPTPVTGPILGGNAIGSGPWIPGLQAQPRATGGIFDVWDSVASFANGGTLPGRAVIQPAVSGAGLVQWAEPSTGGEAFIPLNGGSRSRDIWLETGRRLGALSTFAQGGLNPGPAYVRNLLMQMYPQIGDIGGWRAPDGYNEHSSGNAIDVMIPNWDTPEGKALGDQVAAFALQNADALGLSWVLWQQRSFNAGDTAGKAMEDRGSSTANHLDHVHIFMNKNGGALPNAPLVGAGSAGGGVSFAGGGRAGGGSVFGAGYRTGTGTAGYDEQGQPGFYSPDPKAVREAEERAADAQARIKDADSAVAIAEARKSELDADASQSQRLSAQQSLDKAKADADKARREAQDSQSDLSDAKRGKFTAAKEAKNGKGDNAAGDLTKMIGGGILETFGLDGSFLPNIEDLGIVKLAKAVMGIKYTPQGTGFAGGALAGAAGGGGAGGGFPGASFDAGAGTSGLPFGMVPEVSSMLPSFTGPNTHVGTGYPPGVGNGPVDQSTNLTINNPQGDERSIADRTRRVLLNTPRTMTYEPIGGGR